MARSKSFSIPGLSFSWKRALGITQTKQKIARKTGIPTTKAGLERYLQPIITQYFIDNKSEIWLLFLIAHSKR